VDLSHGGATSRSGEVPGAAATGPPTRADPAGAIGQEWWSVAYRQTEVTEVTAVERRGQQLLVHGGAEEIGRVVDALRRWLARKTRAHVAPWLTTLASDRGLPVDGVAIRSQRTRWASCSAKGVISLNTRLLLLPQELVRYALLHELWVVSGPEVDPPGRLTTISRPAKDATIVSFRTMLTVRAVHSRRRPSEVGYFPKLDRPPSSNPTATRSTRLIF
jgi:hypothetical protein